MLRQLERVDELFDFLAVAGGKSLVNLHEDKGGLGTVTMRAGQGCRVLVGLDGFSVQGNVRAQRASYWSGLILPM
jgi:hypothetical protein